MISKTFHGMNLYVWRTVDYNIMRKEEEARGYNIMKLNVQQDKRISLVFTLRRSR